MHFIPTHIALAETMTSGQAFRFIAHHGGYVGIVDNKPVFLRAADGGVEVDDDVPVAHYLDTGTPYADILTMLHDDDALRPAIDALGEVHILRQSPWETVVSFIISACNNIMRIRGIVGRLCELYGEPIAFMGCTLYTFPSPERLCTLSPAELSPIRAGYRDKYIIDAAQKVASGAVDLALLHTLDNDAAARVLMGINGIGRKVADCILLYGYHRLDVCPKDVWIKRVVAEFYGDGENCKDNDIDALMQRFAPYQGIAQQYLYTYYSNSQNRYKY